MHFLQGQDRHQANLFTKLDDYVGKSHYVRLVDYFVDCFINDNLSLFKDKGDQPVGRKAYNPSILMKIYFYGFFNGITSSRKLEKECGRNIELIWLTTCLAPDHKTIADFKRVNGHVISEVLKEFNKLLKDSGYIKGQTISIDGTKIKANAGLCIDLNTIKDKLDNLEEQLKSYLENLESVDQYEDELESKKVEKENIQEEIENLRKELEELKKQKETLEEAQTTKLSPTDPDARIMKSRHGKDFGYNVQTAVDAENKMIICAQVTNAQNDRGQLLPVIEKVEDILQRTPEETLADAGYYVVEQLEYIEKEKQIECYVPISKNQMQTRDKTFGIKFKYFPEENLYKCSFDQSLVPNKGIKKDSRRGTQAQAYKGSNCPPCPVFEKCTTSKDGRTIYRYSDQEWRDNYLRKMKSREGREKLKQRRSLSEHPFGTIKYYLGYIPLKTRGLAKVQTEIDLSVIAYNFKRWLNISSFETISSTIRSNNWKLGI